MSSCGYPPGARQSRLHGPIQRVGSTHSARIESRTRRTQCQHPSCTQEVDLSVTADGVSRDGDHTRAARVRAEECPTSMSQQVRIEDAQMYRLTLRMTAEWKPSASTRGHDANGSFRRELRAGDGDPDIPLASEFAGKFPPQVSSFHPHATALRGSELRARASSQVSTRGFQVFTPRFPPRGFQRRRFPVSTKERRTRRATP